MGLILLFGLLAGPYDASILEWRQRHEAALRSKDGYLSIAGLFWLKEGANTAGAIELRSGKVVFQPREGPAREMKPDTTGAPDIVQVGRVKLYVIQRGDRFAIRMKDPESSSLKSFRGARWFPLRPEFRVEARFVPYDPPKRIPIASIIGYTDMQPCPGYVVFQLGGRELRLEPVGGGRWLFFIFRDRTSARQTYGAGRFLYSEMPRDGKVILDFNRAENPPCAYNPYTTCPLPPKQNHLPVAIEAGEMTYAGSYRDVVQRDQRRGDAGDGKTRAGRRVTSSSHEPRCPPGCRPARNDQEPEEFPGK